MGPHYNRIFSLQEIEAFTIEEKSLMFVKDWGRLLALWKRKRQLFLIRTYVNPYK